jgi:hypothetical protein
MPIIDALVVIIDIRQSLLLALSLQPWQSSNHCPNHLPAHPRAEQNKHTQGPRRLVDHAQVWVDYFFLLPHHATYALGANSYRYRLFGEAFLLHLYRYSHCGCYFLSPVCSALTFRLDLACRRIHRHSSSHVHQATFGMSHTMVLEGTN